MPRGRKSKKSKKLSGRKYGTDTKPPVKRIPHIGHWLEKVKKWRLGHPGTRVVC